MIYHFLGGIIFCSVNWRRGQADDQATCCPAPSLYCQSECVPCWSRCFEPIIASLRIRDLYHIQEWIQRFWGSSVSQLLFCAFFQHCYRIVAYIPALLIINIRHHFYAETSLLNLDTTYINLNDLYTRLYTTPWQAPDPGLQQNFSQY